MDLMYKASITIISLTSSLFGINTELACFNCVTQSGKFHGFWILIKMSYGQLWHELSKLKRESFSSYSFAKDLVL